MIFIEHFKDFSKTEYSIVLDDLKIDFDAIAVFKNYFNANTDWLCPELQMV